MGRKDIIKLAHLEAAGYANKRKEAYLDRMKQGSVEQLSEEMIGAIWVAHYEGYRDAVRARGEK